MGVIQRRDANGGLAAFAVLLVVAIAFISVCAWKTKISGRGAVARRRTQADQVLAARRRHRERSLEREGIELRGRYEDHMRRYFGQDVEIPTPGSPTRNGHGRSNGNGHSHGNGTRNGNGTNTGNGNGPADDGHETSGDEHAEEVHHACCGCRFSHVHNGYCTHCGLPTENVSNLYHSQAPIPEPESPPYQKAPETAPEPSAPVHKGAKKGKGKQKKKRENGGGKGESGGNGGEEGGAGHKPAQADAAADSWSIRAVAGDDAPKANGDGAAPGDGW